jgi:uncharacterized protein (TIGR03000 family)
MFRTARTFGFVLLVTAAAFLGTPSVGQAQRGGGHGGGHGGGGHFGGGHFAGGHFGGAHVGGYHSPIYHGGIYQRGLYHGGYGYGYGYRHPYYGYYGGYYPYYGGYYPYYGDYGNYNDAYPYAYGDTLGTTVNPGYSDVTAYYLGGDNPPSRPAATYQGSTYYSRSSETPAQLTVRVPADAKVSFNGTEMTTKGPVRMYESPPLGPGQYTYEVRARWNENGREVSQTQVVGVGAGARVEVDFPLTSTAVKTAGQ